MSDNSWHYQLMRHETEGGEVYFAVHEYYPMEQGDAWTEQPVYVEGKSLEEVRNVLINMLEDLTLHGKKDY